MTLRHRIAHALGWYTGRVETFWALFRHGDDKRLMVGFRCDHCGDINHAHEAPRWMWSSTPTGRPATTPAAFHGDTNRAKRLMMEGIQQDSRPMTVERVEAMRNQRKS